MKCSTEVLVRTLFVILPKASRVADTKNEAHPKKEKKPKRVFFVLIDADAVAGPADAVRWAGWAGGAGSAAGGGVGLVGLANFMIDVFKQCTCLLRMMSIGIFQNDVLKAHLRD